MRELADNDIDICRHDSVICMVVLFCFAFFLFLMLCCVVLCYVMLCYVVLCCFIILSGESSNDCQ